MIRKTFAIASVAALLSLAGPSARAADGFSFPSFNATYSVGDLIAYSAQLDIYNTIFGTLDPASVRVVLVDSTGAIRAEPICVPTWWPPSFGRVDFNQHAASNVTYPANAVGQCHLVLVAKYYDDFGIETERQMSWPITVVP